MKKEQYDVTGRLITGKQERIAAKQYKKDNKPWNFPFREAFKRIGVIK